MVFSRFGYGTYLKRKNPQFWASLCEVNDIKWRSPNPLVCYSLSKAFSVFCGQVRRTNNKPGFYSVTTH